MDEKLAQAIAYLRSRGKYVVDPKCEFKPTPSTDRFSILERYGPAGGARLGVARQGKAGGAR